MLVASDDRLTSCLLMTLLLSFSVARPPIVDDATGNKYHVTGNRYYATSTRSPLVQISRPTTADDGAAFPADRPCDNGKLHSESGNRKEKCSEMADADWSAGGGSVTSSGRGEWIGDEQDKPE